MKIYKTSNSTVRIILNEVTNQYSVVYLNTVIDKTNSLIMAENLAENICKVLLIQTNNLPY
jgi:6-pyruvoyl-tetrahydropterin synthase